MNLDPDINTGSINNSDTDAQSSGDNCDLSSSSSSSPLLLSMSVCVGPGSEMDSFCSSPSHLEPRFPEEQQDTAGTVDKGECTRAVTPTVPDGTQTTQDGSRHPKFHYRSRSVSEYHQFKSARGATTMTEEINSLRFFQDVLRKRTQTMQENSPRLNTSPKQEGKQDTRLAVDGFVFPFSHLDHSEFQFYDPEILSRRRWRTEFPFSHWGPWLLGFEARRKKRPGSPLNRLMRLVGLDDVKQVFLSVRDRVRAAQENKEKVSAKSLKLDLIITGNRGTGKSTLAEIYGDYLKFLGVVRIVSHHRSPPRRRKRPFYWSSSSSEDDDSTEDGDSSEDDRYTDGRITEAVVKHDLNDLKDLRSNHKVHVVEGLRENVKRIFGHQTACRHFSQMVDLKDYSEDELLTMLKKMLKKDSLKVEGGMDAPFLRMFIRNLRYGRGELDFGNVKTLQAEFKKVLRRRAERLDKATSKKDTVVVRIPKKSYDLTESDFLGAEPTRFYEESESWRKLEEMAGMEKVKEAVEQLVIRRSINHARAKEGKMPLKVSNNYVFLGPPGTGKTTVATLFGKIVAELGYIESGEVVVKKPTDFIGQYVGQSEDQTREILEEAEGKVLIIDEAHMFYHSSEYGSDASDIYRKGIVDTIVAHVDNEPGNNRCIILMGYQDRMEEFYRKTNPGFQRRFPLEDAFVFVDYDDKALGQILEIMLAQDDIAATEDAKAVAMEVLRRERDRPNFGNGGAVRNLLSRAQVTCGKRMRSLAKKDQDPGNVSSWGQILLEPRDFDPEYDRGYRVDKDCSALFSNLVGFQDIVGAFKGYQRMAANMRKYGLDPREEIPFSFVFKGPPGTGKTTTARALGQIYHDMGLLSTTEVMDCSVTDLIAPGQGQTGLKVQNLLESALGKVLFIDEAYRLGQRDLTGAFISRFAQEAVGELVDCMTKEKYANKLVIVLAGYEKDMDKLMSTNEGLRGRLREMVFPNMRPMDCLRLLQKKLGMKKIKVIAPAKKEIQNEVVRLFRRLGKTEAWANARDVENLSKRIINLVFMKELHVDDKLAVRMEEIVTVLRQLLQERRPKDQMDNSAETSDSS